MTVLEKTGDTPSEKWYERRKTDLSVESENTVETAAKLKTKQEDIKKLWTRN